MFDFLQADFLLSGLDGIKIASSYGDRYLVEIVTEIVTDRQTDRQTDNYSLPPHLSPLRSFLTKVKTDSLPPHLSPLRSFLTKVKTDGALDIGLEG